jgi:hypothetical protein
MGKEGLRSLLVASGRPHPWAYLRDGLCPDLIRVAWARPGAADPPPEFWALAGDGSECPAGLDDHRGRLVLCHWVGPSPDGLPVPACEHDDWRSLAAALERALHADVAHTRLAPGRGLVRPDGSYVASMPELEALLASHPHGLAGTAAARRRVVAQVRRSRLPLRVTRRHGRLRLEAASCGLTP